MIDANGVWMAVGLGLITLLTRCFFFILDRELPFPRWAQRGMPYAPIAALAAVVDMRAGRQLEQYRAELDAAPSVAARVQRLADLRARGELAGVAEALLGDVQHAPSHQIPAGDQHWDEHNECPDCPGAHRCVAGHQDQHGLSDAAGEVAQHDLYLGAIQAV